LFVVAKNPTAYRDYYSLVTKRPFRARSSRLHLVSWNRRDALLESFATADTSTKSVICIISSIQEYRHGILCGM
jgi:hypothetical protein